MRLGSARSTDPRHVRTHLAREPGDPRFGRLLAGSWREFSGSTTPMNGSGKSDRPIVPKKPANAAGAKPLMVEWAEGRGLAKGNLVQQNGRRTQGRESPNSALDRIRQAARRDKGLKFTT